MAFIHSPKIVTDGLVLALDAGNRKSYPGSGTTWTDLSNNANNVTLTANVTFGNDSLTFDGSSADYGLFTAGNPASLGLTNFTLSSWFQTAGTGSSAAGTGTGGITYYPIFSHGGGEVDGSNKDMNYTFGVIFTGSDAYIVGDFEDTTSGQNWPIYASGSIFAINTWVNGVLTYNGVNWAAYLNGNLINISAAINRTPRSDSIQPPAIGTSVNSSNTRSGYFNGKLAIVSAYNRALTATEILQNYNATRSRFGV